METYQKLIFLENSFIYKKFEKMYLRKKIAQKEQYELFEDIGNITEVKLVPHKLKFK